MLFIYVPLKLFQVYQEMTDKYAALSLNYEKFFMFFYLS